jgi:hypothetical protein
LAIRKRTSKSVAKRHDLDYFKKGSPIRLWQWKLVLAAVVAAAVWIASSASRSYSAFSAGPLSAPHTVFAQRCDVCHKPLVPGTGWLPVIGMRSHVPDSACFSCHQVGTHHASVAVSNQPCSSCHIEHISATHLASAPVRGCAQCHANLETRGVTPSIATHIESFTQGHPAFRVLRTASPEVRDAAFGLKFNHAAHLKQGLSGLGGVKTTLHCESCHHLVDVGNRDTVQSGQMARVDFDRSCRSCHSLEFDRRVAEQAPHTDAITVYRFVVEKMATAAPGDAGALVSAQTIIFRQKCGLCHAVSGATALPRVLQTSLDVPAIASARQPERFFSASVFSHSAHGAILCTECHGAALVSTSGKDLLLPDIATCQRCHDGRSNPEGVPPSGHAESGCSLCHLYHEGGRRHANGSSPAFRIDELVPSP